jgi:hypothetical protein
MASESPWAISGVESYYNLSHLMLTELLCVETPVSITDVKLNSSDSGSPALTNDKI